MQIDLHSLGFNYLHTPTAKATTSLAPSVWYKVHDTAKTDFFIRSSLSKQAITASHEVKYFWCLPSLICVYFKLRMATSLPLDHRFLYAECTSWLQIQIWHVCTGTLTTHQVSLRSTFTCLTQHRQIRNCSKPYTAQSY